MESIVTASWTLRGVPTTQKLTKSLNRLLASTTKSLKNEKKWTYGETKIFSRREFRFSSILPAPAKEKEEPSATEKPEIPKFLEPHDKANYRRDYVNVDGKSLRYERKKDGLKRLVFDGNCFFQGDFKMPSLFGKRLLVEKEEKLLVLELKDLSKSTTEKSLREVCTLYDRRLGLPAVEVKTGKVWHLDLASSSLLRDKISIEKLKEKVEERRAINVGPAYVGSVFYRYNASRYAFTLTRHKGKTPKKVVDFLDQEREGELKQLGITRMPRSRDLVLCRSDTSLILWIIDCSFSFLCSQACRVKLMPEIQEKHKLESVDVDRLVKGLAIVVTIRIV